MDGRVSISRQGPIVGRQLIRERSVEHKILLEHAEAGSGGNRQHQSQQHRPDRVFGSAIREEAEQASRSPDARRARECQRFVADRLKAELHQGLAEPARVRRVAVRHQIRRSQESLPVGRHQ